MPRLLLAVPLLLTPGLLPAASNVASSPMAAELAQATAQARAAEAEAARLEKAAAAAQGQAQQLRTRQAAAAEAIAAAEARISAAEARGRMVAAVLEAARAELARKQAPAGALLAGLAMMASRPPMLAVLDQGSAEDYVRVRMLLDWTLPVIRQRTAALSAEVAQSRALQQAAETVRADLVRERRRLFAEQERFAELEQQALRLAEQRGGQALDAGDVALSRTEDAALLRQEQQRRSSASRIAAELLRLPPAPARPGRLAGEERPPLLYRLPADAPVIDGFGSVNSAGIRARGLTLATRRGAAVRAPAAGVVRFSGPFRAYDGIVIVDHGKGWMSLILGVASPLAPGSRVRIGDPIGRALGPIGVELSTNGRHVSPAIIAGSSPVLLNRPKEG